MTWEKRRDELAKEYTKDVNDECLCQRTQPETKYGEHIYCFCGCDIYEAYLNSFDAGRADTLERIQPLLDALEKYIGIPGNDCQGITKYSAAEVALANWRKEME